MRATRSDDERCEGELSQPSRTREDDDVVGTAICNTNVQQRKWNESMDYALAIPLVAAWVHASGAER